MKKYLIVASFLVFAVWSFSQARISNPESANTFITSGPGTAGSVIFHNGTQFAQDNPNLFWDDTNNRVGIGTTSPDVRLHVVSADGNVASLLATTIGIFQENNDTSDIARIMLLGGTAGGGMYQFADSADSDVGGFFYDHNSNFLATYANAGERTRITSAGNLGIGTTTPIHRLHVSSGASATTTVSIGELGLTSSRGCVNMNTPDGSAASFFINNSGTLTAELNYCR